MQTITVKRNGYVVEYVPIIKSCTYHSQQFDEICRNCNNTMQYCDGYHMIITDKQGNKTGFIVDNVK